MFNPYIKIGSTSTRIRTGACCCSARLAAIRWESSVAVLCAIQRVSQPLGRSWNLKSGADGAPWAAAAPGALGLLPLAFRGAGPGGKLKQSSSSTGKSSRKERPGLPTTAAGAACTGGGVAAAVADAGSGSEGVPFMAAASVATCETYYCTQHNHRLSL